MAGQQSNTAENAYTERVDSSMPGADDVYNTNQTTCERHATQARMNTGSGYRPQDGAAWLQHSQGGGDSRSASFSYAHAQEPQAFPASTSPEIAPPLDGIPTYIYQNHLASRTLRRRSESGDQHAQMPSCPTSRTPSSSFAPHVATTDPIRHTEGISSLDDEAIVGTVEGITTLVHVPCPWFAQDPTRHPQCQAECSAGAGDGFDWITRRHLEKHNPTQEQSQQIKDALGSDPRLDRRKKQAPSERLSDQARMELAYTIVRRTMLNIPEVEPIPRCRPHPRKKTRHTASNRDSLAPVTPAQSRSLINSHHRTGSRSHSRSRSRSRSFGSHRSTDVRHNQNSVEHVDRRITEVHDTLQRLWLRVETDPQHSCEFQEMVDRLFHIVSSFETQLEAQRARSLLGPVSPQLVSQQPHLDSMFSDPSPYPSIPQGRIPLSFADELDVGNNFESTGSAPEIVISGSPPGIDVMETTPSSLQIITDQDFLCQHASPHSPRQSFDLTQYPAGVDLHGFSSPDASPAGSVYNSSNTFSRPDELMPDFHSTTNHTSLLDQPSSCSQCQSNPCRCNNAYWAQHNSFGT